MKINTLTALVLFVLTLALGMPAAFRVGNELLRVMHPLPPSPGYADSSVSADELSAQDLADAKSWCKLMQRMGIESRNCSVNGTSEYGIFEQQITDGRIRMDPKDPSVGIYSGIVAQFAYNWQHRDAPPSRYEE